MSRHTRHTHVHVLLKQFAGFLVVRWPQVGRSLNGAMGTAPSLACQAQHRRCHQMHHHAPITTRATTWVAPNAALRGWHINTKPRTGRVETFRECAIEVGNHLWQKGRSELHPPMQLRCMVPATRTCSLPAPPSSMRRRFAPNFTGSLIHTYCGPHECWRQYGGAKGHTRWCERRESAYLLWLRVGERPLLEPPHHRSRDATERTRPHGGRRIAHRCETRDCTPVSAVIGWQSSAENSLKKKDVVIATKKKTPASTGIRTLDLLLTKQMLCQLSYRGELAQQKETT